VVETTTHPDLHTPFSLLFVVRPLATYRTSSSTHKIRGVGPASIGSYAFRSSHPCQDVKSAVSQVSCRSSELSLKTSSLLSVQSAVGQDVNLQLDCHTHVHAQCKAYPSTLQHVSTHNVREHAGMRVYMYNITASNIHPHPHPLSHTQTHPHTCTHIHEHRCRHKSVTVCV